MEPPCTFSIVTVSYNCADAIRKTLESVVGQDYADKEYIIIEGFPKLRPTRTILSMLTAAVPLNPTV